MSNTDTTVTHSLKMIDNAIAVFTSRIEQLDAEKARGVTIDTSLRDAFVDARGYARDVKTVVNDTDTETYSAKLVECALACHDLQVYLQDPQTDLSVLYVHKLKAAIALSRHVIVDPASLF